MLVLVCLHSVDSLSYISNPFFNACVFPCVHTAHQPTRHLPTDSVAKRNFNLFNVLTSPEPDGEDLVAVCQYVMQQLPDPPTELFLVGYSYGATVAASALQQVPQVRLVGCDWCVSGGG